MHKYRSVALDHENWSRRLRDRKPERQWKGEAHRILDVKVFRCVMYGGPEIRGVTKRSDDKSIRRQRIREYLVVVGPARPGIIHHWTSSRDNRSAKGQDASSAKVAASSTWGPIGRFRSART